MPELFDHNLRSLRRDRAVRSGLETFLFDRAFGDCLDRLADMRKSFNDILLAGCPDPSWIKHFGAANVVVVDPGPLMAERAGGLCADLETLPFDGERFDLVLSVGLLETTNELPFAAAALNLVLRKGGLLLGAVAGGHSLPRLRAAMLAADAATGQASPHVHPRIDAPSLAHLLTAAGFQEPVVDVDRIDLAYGSFDKLVHDLRQMGSTNILHARSRKPMARPALWAAREAFLERDARVTEQIEILHFAAWKRA
ncbi:methyltransferase domain-containing protein [Sphingomonas alba]|uniref:Methyltransferase domain-containing protein n=1 Tax=Sphingomonas alba TaxID=2908208 RepID=A0ABT0RNV0_9SPHN|nr:methyltransferase domain-containing protein [Sphingomonas alba]MCL6684316.1 methyltransferase domain-containing protein [Sphingomonas alba]